MALVIRLLEDLKTTSSKVIPTQCRSFSELMAFSVRMDTQIAYKKELVPFPQPRKTYIKIPSENNEMIHDIDEVRVYMKKLLLSDTGITIDSEGLVFARSLSSGEIAVGFFSSELDNWTGIEKEIVFEENAIDEAVGTFLSIRESMALGTVRCEVCGEDHSIERQELIKQTADFRSNQSKDS